MIPWKPKELLWVYLIIHKNSYELLRITRNSVEANGTPMSLLNNS
jgi:hypothetical protein